MDAPAQDLTPGAQKGNVPQADTCSCALPYPACSLLIPQGCAAGQGIPSSQRIHSKPLLLHNETLPRQEQSRSWAGTWQGGKSLPGRAGSTALAIPTPGAFSWESPAAWPCLCSLGVLGAAHTCTPMCASLPLLPPHVLLLPPGDIPSWPGCPSSLCLWNISFPGSCYKQFLLSGKL